MKQKIINVEGTTLDDSWFQLVFQCLQHGRKFKIDKGSFAGCTRLELDFIVVHILRPWERNPTNGMPLIPVIPEHLEIPPPVTEEYLTDYADYFLSGTKKLEETYTYGQRLNNYRWNAYRSENPVAFALDQVTHVIDTYRDHGYRNNQMVLQIAEPKDLKLSDPPCLRHIDTRIQDGKLHFYPYFRSWDLWSGYPANLAGISILQEHMASEIGVEQGEMICTSKGLHIYDYAISFAEMRCMFECKS